MISSCATHPGLVRQSNEDCLHTDDNLGIYLLADGIGGHNAGEVASSLAVEVVYSIVRSNIDHTAVEGYFELMMYAMHTAHWEIFSRAQADPQLAKMGTTLVMAIVRDNKGYIVNAGDSRCYLYQRNIRHSSAPSFENEGHGFKRLTHDHTVGDQLLASGIAIGEIPKRQFHTLTRSLGCGNPPYPDFNVVELRQGDMLLICSDGLTDMLTDEEIEVILAKGGFTLEERAHELVNSANAHGGRDNISVVLIASP